MAHPLEMNITDPTGTRNFITSTHFQPDAIDRRDLYVKSPTLGQINRAELVRDPFGRPNTVYHPASDQAFPLPPQLYSKLFPEPLNKSTATAIELYWAAQHEMPEPEEASPDSVFGLLTEEDKKTTGGSNSISDDDALRIMQEALNAR